MIKVNYDWLTSLRKIFNNDPILDWVQLALHNQGFISGGGARTIGRFILDETNTYPKRIISRNTNKGLSTVSFVKKYFTMQLPRQNENPYWKATSGDIDVFFRDAEGAEETIKKVSKFVSYNQSWHISPSEAGWAQDVSTENLRAQFISKIVGNPEEITSKFDIINGTCWLDATSFNYSPQWLELEKANEIGLQGPCDKHNLAWRVSKWIWRGHYSTLSQESQKTYIDNCLLTMSAIKSKDGLKRFDKDVTAKNLKSKLRDINIETLSIENLLYASMLLDSYEQMQVFSELSSRL